jgi:hypothetical protein
MKLHHGLPDVAHRHASLDDKRIRGEIGDSFKRGQRIAQMIEHAQEQHDIEPSHAFGTQVG